MIEKPLYKILNVNIVHYYFYRLVQKVCDNYLFYL